MSAEVETMAYRMRDRSDTPWHGLGKAIDSDATPEQMIVQAGLDWQVLKNPMWTSRGPDPHIPDPASLHKLEDYFSLVRSSDSKLLGICGKEYVPTQNSQAFAFFKKFCDAGSMSMETAGSLQGGKQVWVLAKIAKFAKLPGDDQVNGYLLMSSPHVWGKSLVLKFVAIRVVCMNTFVMAMSGSGKSFRMPHLREFDAAVMEQAESALGIAEDSLDEFAEKALLLANAKVDASQVARYVADVFQPELIVEGFGKAFYDNPVGKQAELLMAANSPKVDPTKFKRSSHEVLSCINRQPGADLESARGTLWGAFNATTYYLDHVSGRIRDNALYSSWFGPNAALKARALDRATEMASAQ